ncbi:MAG: leucine-rich repeat protein [Clostridia bacterium]|nr:leucine-rich repeat protein [Clostridia bacterium]
MKFNKKLWCLVLCTILTVLGTLLLTACDDECSHALCTDWTVTKQSTCNEFGSKTRTCQDCGEVFTESVAKKTHKYSEYVYDNNVSCTSAGTKSATCQNCGDVKKEINPGNPYGHTFFDGKCSACAETTSLIASYDASRTDTDSVMVKVYKQADGQLILDVVGSGEMKDYSTDAPAPWASYAAGIKTIHFYEGVKRIGDYAFRDLYNVSNVMVERGLESFGENVFNDTYKAAITYVFDIPTWVSFNFEDNSFPAIYMTKLIYVGEVTTNTSGNKYVKNPSTTIGELVIPEGVKKINAYSFFNCAHMTTVSIPESLEKIGNYAFYGCSRLSEVHLSSINAWCEIELGDSYANPITVAKEIFFDGNMVQELVIDGVDTIAPYAFEGCTSIIKLTLNGVSSIGTRAFSECSYISKINLQNTKEIGKYAFYANTALDSLTLPPSLETLNEGAFKNCTRLSSVDVGDCLDVIGDSAFAGCHSIVHLEFGAALSLIDKDAFTGCYKIVEIYNRSKLNENDSDLIKNARYVYTAGASRISEITDEGDGAGLILYTDDEGVTIIGYKGGESLVLSKTAIGEGYKIGSYAFYNSALKNVTVIDEPAGSYKNAFDGVSIKKLRLYDVGAWCGIYFEDETANPVYYAEQLYIEDAEEAATDIKIPDTVTAIAPYAFAGCGSVTKIDIPTSVTSIGEKAFLECTKAMSKLGGVFYIGSWIVDYDNTVNTVTISNTTVGVAEGVFKDASIKEVIAPMNMLSHFKSDSIVTLTVSASTIGANAFADYTALEKLSVATAVTEVDPMAFAGLRATAVSLKFNYAQYLDASKITALTITGGNISASVVSGFVNLKSLVIGGSVSGMEADSFANLTALETVSINAAINIPANAFKNCTSVRSISLTNGIKSIAKDAFLGCDKAKTDKDGVIYIGGWIVGTNTDKDYIVISADTVGIQDGAISSDAGITRIFYKGKSAAWKKVVMNLDNTPAIKSATVYYYNEIKPASTGSFWHYVAGVPEIWA